MEPKFRQAKWDEPLIFDLSREGKIGHKFPDINDEIKKTVGDIYKLIPKSLVREKKLNLPELSEVDVVNHFTRLSQMNYGVDLGLYPLGSCTMKYNPRIDEIAASLEQFAYIHPYQDESTVQGALEILYYLQKWTAELTGMDDVSLQPAAGAHGEYAGVRIIYEYFKQKGEIDKRRDILVPDSAHGTNPASAAMAGFRVVVIPSTDEGTMDLDALKSAVSDQTAGLMLTNPNTLGLFESDIKEIAEAMHNVGGLLYYDGANLNANLCKTRPGDMGFDIVHVNFHKTFATPHGGGGPGAGAVGVKRFLREYLPVPIVEFNGKKYYFNYDLKYTIGKIKAFYGNFLVLIKAFTYILTLGKEGLEKAAEDAVLNANYLGEKIKKFNGFSLPYGEGKPRKHEAVISAEPMHKEYGVSAKDVAKRILDYGMHAPTFYFPLIVHEALMIEPTESYDKDVMDMYIRIFEEISKAAKDNKELLHNAPHNTSKRRLNDAKASKPRYLAVTWKMAKKKNLL